MGVLATLALVLALLGITLKLLKKFAPGALGGGRHGKLPMEVVQRLALGPKQGIAVVRIGSQTLAVSIGEGGVRPLMTLAGADRAEILSAPAPAALFTMPEPGEGRAARGEGRATSDDRQVASVAAPRDFRDVLRFALSSATKLAVAAIVLAGATTAAHAQAAPATKPAAQAALPNATPAAPNATSAVPNAAKPIAGLPGVVTRTKLPASVSGSPTPLAGPVAPPVPVERRGAGRADSKVTRLAPQIDLRVGGKDSGGLRLSGTVGVVVMMGLLTLLPTLLLMMTGFTRILIVLHFLKQALGTQSAPPNHLVGALALLLTGFVMGPTLAEVNRTALTPWMDGKIEQAEMLSTGVKPFREFMLRQTRDRDIETFVAMSQLEAPKTPEDTPLIVLVSAFVTSELRTAFQIGFALFLPFIVIDVVVSAVLMSMGMMMLPPAMIALPFKLLLFVLVDGWGLVISGLVQSFH